MKKSQNNLKQKLTGFAPTSEGEYGSTISELSALLNAEDAEDITFYESNNVTNTTNNSFDDRNASFPSFRTAYDDDNVSPTTTTEEPVNTPLAILRKKSGKRCSRFVLLALKLCSYSLIGIIFMALFRLVFLPRTSLSRDLKWLHSDKLTKSDLFRIFLEIDTSNSNGSTTDVGNLFDSSSTQLIQECMSLKCKESVILQLLKDHYEPYFSNTRDLQVDENCLVLTVSGLSASAKEKEKVIIGTDITDLNSSSLKIIDSIIFRLFKLKKLSWKPLRDITFVIWKSSSHNQMSEQYLMDKFGLSKTYSLAIAYIELSSENTYSWESDLLLQDIIHATSKMLLYKDSTLYKQLFENSPRLRINPINKQNSDFEKFFSIPSIKMSTIISKNGTKDYDITMNFLGYLILNFTENEIIFYNIHTLSLQVIDYISRVYDYLIQNSDQIDLQLSLNNKLLRKIFGNQYHEYESILRKYEGLTILNFLEKSMIFLSTMDDEILQMNKKLRIYQDSSLLEDFPSFSFYKKINLLFRIKYINIMLRNVNKLFEIFDAEAKESTFYLYPDSIECDNKILIPRLENALRQKDIYECIKLLMITIFNLHKLSDF